MFVIGICTSLGGNSDVFFFLKHFGEGFKVRVDDYLDRTPDERRVEGHVGNGDRGNGEEKEHLAFSVDHACHRHGIHVHDL